MELGRRRSLISSGEQFNVADLDGERTRISTLLRNVGCYYFRPDYLTYQADTMMVPNGHVQMRLIPVPGMPKVAEKQFRVGRKSVYLLGKQGQEPNDSMDYKRLDHTLLQQTSGTSQHALPLVELSRLSAETSDTGQRRYCPPAFYAEFV